jgi:hypothetical protein
MIKIWLTPILAAIAVWIVFFSILHGLEYMAKLYGQ